MSTKTANANTPAARTSTAQLLKSDPVTNDAANQAVKKILGNIEALGGVKGYEAWVAKQKANPAPKPQAVKNLGTGAAGITGDVGIVIAGYYADINVFDSSGSWSADTYGWAAGAFEADLIGELTYSADSLSDFANQTANFTVVGGGEVGAGGSITFYDGNGNFTGQAELAGEGEGVGTIPYSGISFSQN